MTVFLFDTFTVLLQSVYHNKPTHLRNSTHVLKASSCFSRKTVFIADPFLSNYSKC